MSNPFENENGLYKVLINEEGQYSMWPSFLAIPKGWSVAFGEDSRKSCLDYINEKWTNLQPNSIKSETSLAKERG